ncbi:hypothetical protein BD414DRAFT_507528 [Trametes punicea]|nr:hypothetical protein BD414DRAFT_507528 [Trametes punicea]
MYKLIRRISSSFFPRPDRPWSEDATSTAPQIGRKRRLSTNEREERETTPSAKKHRAESEATPESERGQSPAAATGRETEEVKEVTKGVREVELEDGKPSALETTEGVADEKIGAEEAAAVPLPDSPELKPTEDDQKTEGKVVPAQAGQSGDSVPIDEASKSSDSPKATLATEDTPAASAEDEIPGLTLAAQAEEKITSTIPSPNHTDTHSLAATDSARTDEAGTSL